MDKNKKKVSGMTPLPVIIFTPVLILIICVSIIVVAGITPYNKFSTYLNIVFSDKMKTTDAATVDVSDADLNLFKRDPAVSISKTGKTVHPGFGEQYAVLTCETADMYVPIYWGSSQELLNKGACQLSASAVIGEKGNTVIDAHVNTFFANLSELKENDIIKLNTAYGEFSYRVKEQVIFEKTDKTYISPSNESKLTLYTCVKQILGSSSQRLAVICEPVESAFYN